jgi:long-chain acyl-CoA synthetase
VEPRLFPSLWTRVVNKYQDQPAIYGENAQIVRTFNDIESERLHWREQLAGFEPGSTIMVQLSADCSWPAILLACLDLSLVMVPLEFQVTGAQLENVTRVTNPHASVRGTVISRRHSASPAWPEPPPDLLKMTSGTTGLPRAIRFRESQLLSDCRNICATMGLLATDINFAVIPFAHSYGFSNLVTPLLYQGTRFVASQDPLPRAIQHQVQISGATVLPATPAIFQALCSLPENDHLGQIRLCISAGAPLPAGTVHQFFDRFGLRLHSFYGSSECGGIMFDREGRLDALSGFVGRPMDGVEILRLPNDRIEIRGPNVADGYFPEAEPDVLQAGRFIPGDLVRWEGDSAQVYGRASDVINVAGKKFHPSIVEEHIRKLPGVLDVIAFGVPSPNRNEDLVALVMGDVPMARQTLEAHCRAGLADWQVPREFQVVTELPVNARGKVSRAELAAEYMERKEQAGTP